MEIEYILSNGFVGQEWTMIVDGKSWSLYKGPWRYEEKWGDHIDHAIYILKKEYNIIKKREQINFEWDGTL